MSRAEILVAKMLESELVPVCYACQKEKGLPTLQPGQEPSHGLCRRHQRETYKGFPLHYSDEQADSKVSHMAPDEYWHDRQ